MSAERCNCGTHTKEACDFAGACGPVAAPLPAAPASTEQAEPVSLETACDNLIAYIDKNPPMGESLWCVQQIRAARQAPTEAPKLNQQQEETITMLRMWSEAGHRDLRLLSGDKFGVLALLAGFDRQAPDSRDAALESQCVAIIGFAEAVADSGLVPRSIIMPLANGTTDRIRAMKSTAATAQEKAQ